MYQSHEDYRQAQVQSAYHLSPLLLSTPNSTHDMNKTVQAVPSGMYQTNPGAIPGGATQHHQPGMGGPNPATSLVQGQPINPRSHITSMVNYSGRPNATHSMPNMSRPPIPNVINQSNPQAPQQYSAHMPNVVLSSHPSFQPSIAPQPMFMPHHGQIAQLYSQRTPHYPQQQYSQHMFNYYTPANIPGNNMFYPVSHVTATCPPASINQASQIQQTQKKEKKILTIVDPITGRNIFEKNENTSEECKTNAHSSGYGSEICLQFAAQVAAVASSDTKVTKSLDKEKIGDPQPAIHSNSINVIDSLEGSDNGILEVEACEQYSDNEVLNSCENTVAYCDTDDPAVHSNSINDCVSLPSEINAESNLVKPAEIVEPFNHVDHELFITIDNSKSDIKNISSTVAEETVVSVCIEDENEVDSAVFNLIQTAIEVHTDSVDILPETLSEVSEIKDFNSNDIQHESQSVEETVQTDVVTAKTDKPSEVKKGKKNKKKDLNRKGESKEGGDMDAFLDKTLENTPTSVTTSPSSDVPVLISPTAQKPSLESIDVSEINCVQQPEENEVIVPEPAADDDTLICNENAEEKNDEISNQDTPKFILKYTYKEDQWSPLNPEGKKQYDRDFLLELQSQPMSLQKPLNLPNLDVIKDKAQLHKLTNVVRNSAAIVPTRHYADPFMPLYARGGVPKLPFPGGINRRSQQGREKQKKTITFGCSLRENIKLHESENAWKPATYKPESDDIEEGKSQELYKKVRGILNKLTPQKFETLVEQVKQLEITTEERLKGVIDLVFEKAIDEPNFSVPYANMCKQLALIKVPVPVSDSENDYVNFRKLLLTKCQREFEKDKNEELRREEYIKKIEECETAEKKKQLQEEFEEAETRNRRRQLGNIRFIGELFKLGMLIEPIMHECINKLLSQGDADSLECLTRLLTTIGKELESDKKSKDTYTPMDNYFNTMQKIVNQRQTSSRVRFMLQDLIDLRRNKWVPRRDENNPKTIEQIHKEAEREAQEQQQMLQNMPFTKRMPDDRDRRKGNSNTGRNPAYEDGWITSNKSSKGNYTLDPMKLKLTKPAEVENIQLGPGGKGFANWGRGSSGGTKTPSIESNGKTSAVLTNRYSALADQASLSNYEVRNNSQRSTASSRESSRGRTGQQSSSSLRKTPSTSKERESLLETVKGFARGGQAEPKQEELKVTDMQSVNGKDHAAELRGPELDEEIIENKTKPLIDEFLHNADFDEAIQCIIELASPSTVHFVIKAAINRVLERSSQARYSLGQLLHSLVVKKLVTMEQYNKGLEFYLELVDDFAVDIPKIWEYLGEIIEPMIDGSATSLQFLKETLQPCIPSTTAGKLLSAVLHCAAKKRGTVKVGDLWRSSGLDWRHFLGDNADVSDFIKVHNLEFTVSQIKSESKEDMSFIEIKEKLDFYLRNGDENNEEIFDWIESHIEEAKLNEPTFIRALVTAVHESAITGSGAKCEFSREALKKRLPLLQRYVAHKEDLELQGLYALQALLNKLDQPKGILRSIFDCLYDEDVITEDTFKKWEQSKDPAEQEGKGVAVLSVAAFFTWLKEADDESSGEADEESSHG